MKATRPFGLALTLLTALALSSPLAPAWAGEPGVHPAAVAEHPAAGLVYDQWYLDTVDGQPSGYTHEWLTILDDGRVETGYASRRVESHGGDLMVSDSRVVWLETADLRPISVTSESSAGTETVRQTYTLLADGIELVSEQSGRTTTRRLPAVVGDWLSPTAFELAWRERVAAGEDVFELTTWDPDMGSTPVTLRYEREDAEQLEMPTGEVVETTRWKVNYSAIPGVDLYELYDADAVMLAQRVSFAGLDMASYLTDESVVALEFEPPEMAGNSTVRPDQPIRRPQRVQRAVFDLTFGDGAPEDLLPPTTPHQRAERLDNGKVRLTVDLGVLNALAEQDTPGTDPSYMDASIMIDHSDEEVRRLAEVVRGRAGDEPDAERYAKAARRYVTRYVTGLNLATGDATASEVARNRSGDCTECSVLLAAILRAQGIPSRCVTGLAYADTEFAGESDVFVYHMWTQAWIEDASEQGGRWLDLDAALYRYTATHITLGTSAMGDAEAAGEMIRMLPLMNGLVIEVVETEQ